MSILRSLPRLKDTGLIDIKEKKRQSGNEWKESTCVFAPSSPAPIVSILVWGKVFAQVLMGEITMIEAGCMRGTLFTLTEIQTKPKISLEGENVRQAGIRRCSQDPDPCVCDPAALDSLSVCLNQDKVRHIEADIKRTPSTDWSRKYTTQ